MVIKFLDLIFYKVYSVYVKKEYSPVYTTILFLGLIRISILLFILLFLHFTLGLSFHFEGYSTTNRKYIGAFLILLIELPLLLYTYYRYTRKGKIKELEEKYSDTKYDRIRPWYVFMLPVFFIILMLIMVFTLGDVVFLPGRN